MVSESSSGVNSSLMNSTTPSDKILRYASAFTAPESQMIKGPGLPLLKHAQTIIETFPDFTVPSQCLRKYAWPFFRMQRRRRDFRPRTIELSSDHITFIQSSTVQFAYFLAQCKRAAL